MRSSSSDAPRAAAAATPGGDPAALRRVIVTGAAGMLGGAVAACFARRYEVIEQQRSDADLADLRATADWITARDPHLVVNCAAYADVDGCERDVERAWRDNAWAARNVALACQLAGAALCHVSTDYVFDGEKADPYLETDTPAPLNVYGRTKLAGEMHVTRHAPVFWIARTSWVFGPGGRNFVRTMAGLLGERDEVRVVDDQRGAPTYTPDLAAALLLLVETAPPGLYNVTNAGECSWFELARHIGARQHRGRVVPCTTEEFPRPARRPHNSRLASEKWRAAGLPALRPWDEAVDAYLEILALEPGT